MLDARFGAVFAAMLGDVHHNVLRAAVGLASLVGYEVASHKDGVDHGDLGCGGEERGNAVKHSASLNWDP